MPAQDRTRHIVSGVSRWSNGLRAGKWSVSGTRSRLSMDRPRTAACGDPTAQTRGCGSHYLAIEPTSSARAGQHRTVRHRSFVTAQPVWGRARVGNHAPEVQRPVSSSRGLRQRLCLSPAARLGNKANRGQFVNAFWYDKEASTGKTGTKGAGVEQPSLDRPSPLVKHPQGIREACAEIELGGRGTSMELSLGSRRSRRSANTCTSLRPVWLTTNGTFRWLDGPPMQPGGRPAPCWPSSSRLSTMRKYGKLREKEECVSGSSTNSSALRPLRDCFTAGRQTGNGQGAMSNWARRSSRLKSRSKGAGQTGSAGERDQEHRGCVRAAPRYCPEN